MKILIVLPGFIPSTIIGVLRPLSKLESLGEVKLRIRLSSVSFALDGDVRWCDVAVFCRNSEIKDLFLLYKLKRLKKRIIYELDDNFEEISLKNEVGLYHREFARLHALRRFFQLSDVTRVYSETLLQRAVLHGANAVLLRSYFDYSIISDVQKDAPDGLIRIAYPTGRIDDPELEMQIFTAIKIILDKFPNKVEFHLWRETLPSQLEGVRGVVLNKAVKGYEQFIRKFYQLGFDIGIAPGQDTPFFHSKTNNKYREFGGCGIAGIYSNFPPYSNSISDGITGLLVGGSLDDWVKAIEKLILNPSLRHGIVKNAFEDVSLNYSFDSAVQSWRDSLKSLMTVHSKIHQWQLRRNDYPIYGYSSLVANGDDNIQDKFRLKCFELALSKMGQTLLIKSEDFSEYFKSAPRFKMVACFFLFNDMSKFESLMRHVNHSRSAIIDLTKYVDDVSILVRMICKNTKTVCSFVVSMSQYELLEKDNLNYSLFKIFDTNPDVVVQEYSLSGYPSAYIDACERHIQFGPEYIIKYYANVFKLFQNKLNNKYFSIKYKLGIALLLLKCRVGSRKF